MWRRVIRSASTRRSSPRARWSSSPASRHLPRAQAMAAGVGRQNPGTMTAIMGLSLDDAREVCEVAGRGDTLAVANENGPKQTVLSGSLAAITRAEELARSRGAKAVRLQVAGAFHSPLMAPAVQPVREAHLAHPFRGTGVSRHPQRERQGDDAPARPSRPAVPPPGVARPLGSTMRAMADMGVGVVIEAGPGDVLGKLARRALPDAIVRSVGSPAQVAEVATVLRDAARCAERGGMSMAEGAARPLADASSQGVGESGGLAFRLVVSPAAGRMRHLPPVRFEDGVEYVTAGQPVAVIEQGSSSVEVRAPVDARVSGSSCATASPSCTANRSSGWTSPRRSSGGER